MKAPRIKAMWQQVAQLRPYLRQGVHVLTQEYRGERWYLLHDTSKGRFLRFNKAAYTVLDRLDGDLTLREILELAVTSPDGAELTAEDVLQIVAQLHSAELLRGAFPVSTQDLLDRYHNGKRMRRRRTLSNPLALRIQFFDPDRLLDRLAHLARPLFSTLGLWLWIVVVGVAAMVAFAHATELQAALATKTLDPREVLLFWALYPLIKTLHELGHGLAVKVSGGEVHETGIKLLVFVPVPYVDASAATVFRNKRRRALVSAAGILVELFLAALAILVWTLVEPGLVRDAALNVALVGGVSTLLFNGNPLLRYDGYYVLEDLVEIPGLASRSTRYYLYLIQRWILALEDARSPVTARGERAWFIVYGLVAPLYRLSILVGIGFYLASNFLVVGVALASWTIITQVIRPIFLSLRFLATSPRLAARRTRAFGALALVIVLLGGLLAVPLPLVTLTEGVTWVDDRAQVISAADGFVTELVVRSGATVSAGDVLVRLNDPALRAQHAATQARLRELDIEQVAARTESRVRAAMIADDIATVRLELQQLDTRLKGLTVVSPQAGRFVLLDPHELRGRFVHHGDTMGYVIPPNRQIVRAVVNQAWVGLLRSRETAVQVMFADRLNAPVEAHVLREVPAGTTALPSNALGAFGGGVVTTDGADESGRTAAERVFQFDLELPAGSIAKGLGERVYVRLQLGREPLWRQWKRSLRQLLLSRLET